MLIGVPAETRANEARVAATPETVKKYVAAGHSVCVERGAGAAASFPDEAYAAAGAMLGERAAAYAAEIVLKVQAPDSDELPQMKRGAVLVGMLDPFGRRTGLQRPGGGRRDRLRAGGRAAHHARAEPGRAVLAGQHIAGYKAVLVAAATRTQRFLPMLMTAAGTVKAARVLVHPWARAWRGCRRSPPAKRLGRRDRGRPTCARAVKEQIESLGGEVRRRALRDRGGAARRPRAPAATRGRCRANVAGAGRQAEVARSARRRPTW